MHMWEPVTMVIQHLQDADLLLLGAWGRQHRPCLGGLLLRWESWNLDADKGLRLLGEAVLASRGLPVFIIGTCNSLGKRTTPRGRTFMEIHIGESAYNQCAYKA